MSTITLDPRQLELLAAHVAAVLTSTAPATIVAPVVEPVVVEESIWTADQTVRWVDKGAGARNDSGARIPDGAHDPLGLLAVAAAHPGRPVFPEGFTFKTGKPLPANAVIVRPGKRTRAGRTERTIVTAPQTVVKPSMEKTMAAWATRPDVKTVMSEFAQLAAHFVGREYTFRDVLAAAGGAPARTR